MIHYLTPAGRKFAFQYFMEDWAAPAGNFAVIDAEEFITRTSFEPGTYVFAVDDIEPAERRVFNEIWNHLAAAAPRVQLLNHPAQTLGRLELLDAMADSKRNTFRAVRATEWPAALRYPVFIRERERHNGSMTALLHTARDVSRSLRWFAMKGFHPSDLLVVEYLDTADAHGLYRKYSAYVVGDRIIPREIEYGRTWMVKHDFRMFDDTRIQEEFEYVTHNPHESWLREVFALANVTYGRADYALKNGVPQLFEINLNPTVGRSVPKGQESEETLQVRARRRANHETFYAAFNAAWQALDAKSAGSEPVQVQVDNSLMSAAASERKRRIRNDRMRAAISRVTSNAVVAAAVRILRRRYLHS